MFRTYVSLFCVCIVAGTLHAASSVTTDKIRLYSSFIADMAAHDEFSGVVLLADENSILVEQAYGMAQKSQGIENSLRTRFDLASISKLFTTITILQLVEEGRVDLDASLSTYLDATWVSGEIGSIVTVRHLLTHSSGLGNFITNQFMNGPKDQYRSLSDYKGIISQAVLAFQPGTDFGYSNTAYLLAGAIIEEITGLPYDGAVQSRIWDKANMVDTSCDADEFMPDMAIGYMPTSDGGERASNGSVKFLKGTSAGGCSATARDMYRFGQALISNTLLSPAMTEEMFTRQPSKEGVRIGLGIFLGKDSTDRTAAHGGFFPGASGSFDLYIDRGIISVILSNYSKGTSEVRSNLKTILRE